MGERRNEMEGEQREREREREEREERESMYAKEGVDGSQIEHISNTV